MNLNNHSDRKCILVVDDTALILRRITDDLSAYYDVVTANSGLRAMKYLDKNKPDLILLDIQMPNLNGFQVLQLIHAMEDRADIPVIVLTGSENSESVMKSIEMGVRGYILKPFSTSDLLERIRKVLEPEEFEEPEKSGEPEQSEKSEEPEESDSES